MSENGIHEVEEELSEVEQLSVAVDGGLAYVNERVDGLACRVFILGVVTVIMFAISLALIGYTEYVVRAINAANTESNFEISSLRSDVQYLESLLTKQSESTASVFEDTPETLYYFSVVLHESSPEGLGSFDIEFQMFPYTDGLEERIAMQQIQVFKNLVGNNCPRQSEQYSYNDENQTSSWRYTSEEFSPMSARCWKALELLTQKELQWSDTSMAETRNADCGSNESCEDATIWVKEVLGEAYVSPQRVVYYLPPSGIALQASFTDKYIIGSAYPAESKGLLLPMKVSFNVGSPVNNIFGITKVTTDTVCFNAPTSLSLHKGIFSVPNGEKCVAFSSLAKYPSISTSVQTDDYFLTWKLRYEVLEHTDTYVWFTLSDVNVVAYEETTLPKDFYSDLPQFLNATSYNWEDDSEVTLLEKYNTFNKYRLDNGWRLYTSYGIGLRVLYDHEVRYISTEEGLSIEIDWTGDQTEFIVTNYTPWYILFEPNIFKQN